MPADILRLDCRSRTTTFSTLIVLLRNDSGASCWLLVTCYSCHPSPRLRVINPTPRRAGRDTPRPDSTHANSVCAGPGGGGHSYDRCDELFDSFTLVRWALDHPSPRLRVMNHPGTSCHPSAEGNFVPQRYGCSSHIRCKEELRPRWERTKFPSIGGVARYRAPRDVSRGWLGRGGKRVRNYPLTLLSFGGFLSNLGASKVLRRADARLASQPCGFSPLCFKAQQKKSTIRWIFIKLWCEQSTSPR